MSQKRRKQEFVKKIERMVDPALVSIDDAAIAALELGELPEGGIGGGESAPEQASTALCAIRFALAANAINHQFWDVVDGKFERYRHGQNVGAVAMMAGLRSMLEEAGSFEALESRLPLKTADIERWFGPMPDPFGRAQALGEALGRKGKAAALLLADAAAEGEAWGIDHAGAIATLLPTGYEDPLLKKAQLCLWMAKGMLEAKGCAAPAVECCATRITWPSASTPERSSSKTTRWRWPFGRRRWWRAREFRPSKTSALTSLIICCGAVATSSSSLSTGSRRVGIENFVPNKGPRGGFFFGGGFAVGLKASRWTDVFERFWPPSTPTEVPRPRWRRPRRGIL
jgi:hypothetical protein